MNSSDYDKIFAENLDLTDKYTRKYIAMCEDSQKDAVVSALTNALYNKIVDKATEIDFGTIPKSRGDITKVENINMTEECLDIIRKLAVEYKQNPNLVDEIINAIANTKDLKRQFVKGYALNVEMPMLIYNLVVLSIVRSTSMIIATCVKYVSDPSNGTMKQAFDKIAYKNTEDDLIFEQLVSYNKMVKNGSMTKLLDSVIKNSVSFKESYQFMSEAIDYEEEITINNSEDNDNASSADLFPDENPISNDTVNNQAPDYDDTTDPDATDPNQANNVVSEPLPSTEVPPADVVPGEQPTSNPADVPANPTPDTTDLEPIDPENGVSEGVIDSIAGKVEKIVGDSSKSKAIAKGAAIAGVALGALTIISLTPLVLKLIINFLRNLVYTFYNTKMKISDYFDVQAQLLEANATELENSIADDDEKKKKAVEKQRKIAESFRKISNFFNIDKTATKKQTEKDIEDDEKNKKKIGKDEDDNDILF